MNNLTIEEKNQLKLERLQTTLNRAYKNVPFHRNRFLECRLLPENIVSLHDIEQLPFMDLFHLGIHYPYGLFAVPLRDIVRIHTAPGTGRNPSISGYTKADLMIWQKLVARSLEAAGVTSLDILQINLPPGLANWGRDYKDGAENMGASVIPNSPLSVAKTLMVLRDYKTTTLVTTLVFAEQLMEYMFASERNPNEFNLKRIVLVGEPVKAEHIKNLEEHLHVDVWLNYGLSEIPGPAIAFECLEHCGMHINDDHILPEIIDPVTREVVHHGQIGELVLTTLSARAFPLIRFRTGDMARFLNSPCKCGSPLMTMEWLPERADNMMIISGIKISREQVIIYLQDSLGVNYSSNRVSSLSNRASASSNRVGASSNREGASSNREGASSNREGVSNHSSQGQEPILEKIRHGGTEILSIALPIDDSLFSDEIRNLENLMINTSETLAELIGVPVKITLTEKTTLKG